MHDIAFTVNIFRERETFVAHTPELDVSSCGDTQEAAGQNIRDAVLGFLEAADEQGTLVQVLEESGYRKEGESWRAPELISTGRIGRRSRLIATDRPRPIPNARPGRFPVFIQEFPAYFRHESREILRAF